MSDPMKSPDRDAAQLAARLTELQAKATPGPWRSMRDGNQYLRTRYMPNAELVGASRIEGVCRPWNPHAYVAFGFKPEEFETVRFLDDDADLVAELRNALPQIINQASELVALRQRVLALECALRPFAQYAEGFGPHAREDSWIIATRPSGTKPLTMGHVREALAALPPGGMTPWKS